MAFRILGIDCYPAPSDRQGVHRGSGPGRRRPSRRSVPWSPRLGCTGTTGPTARSGRP